MFNVRRLMTLVIMLLVGLSTVGCNDPVNPLEEAKEFYEAPHQLRKMFEAHQEVTVKEPARGNVSGGFFLFVGGVSGEFTEGTTITRHVTHVRFAWEIEDNTYAITTLPLEKIRVRLVEEVDTPAVSFFLDEYKVNEVFERYDYSDSKVENYLGRILKDYYNPYEAFDKYLGYAVFTVEEGDWPENINLPTGGFGEQ